MGENGAGKSSLVACLARILEPEEGEVRLDGAPLPSTPDQVRQAGVEVLWQDHGLCDDLDVVANVFLGRERGRWMIAESQMREGAASVLRRVGAETLPLDRPVRGLSRGQRQLVALGRVLDERPAGGAAGRAHGRARRRRDAAGPGRDPPVPRRRGGHPAGDPRPRSGVRAGGPGGRAPRRPRRGRRLAARGAPRRHRGAHVGHRDGLDGPAPAPAAAEPGRPALRRRAGGVAAAHRLGHGRGPRPGDALRAPARPARWRPRGAAPPRRRRAARAAAGGERSAGARRRGRVRGAGRGRGRGRGGRGPVRPPGARALPPGRGRVGHPQRVGRADRRHPRRAGHRVGLRHLGRPARAGTARAGARSTSATWRRPSSGSGCCPRCPAATASSSRCAGCSRRWPGPTGWSAASACRCWR